MFETISAIIIICLFIYLVRSGGVKTIWYYYEPGEIKWPKWKRKKKK